MEDYFDEKKLVLPLYLWKLTWNRALSKELAMI